MGVRAGCEGSGVRVFLRVFLPGGEGLLSKIAVVGLLVQGVEPRQTCVRLVSDWSQIGVRSMCRGSNPTSASTTRMEGQDRARMMGEDDGRG